VISVTVIEDNRLIRDGIAALLKEHPDLKVAAGASSADSSMLRASNPQVVLLDLGRGRASGLRLAERVKRDAPRARVILMDVLPVYEDILEFVNHGVSGFIVKDATPDDLVNTIRSVAQGAIVLPPHMTSARVSPAKDAARRGPETLEGVRMTPREREVINLIAAGLSNKEIGARLAISIDTVKSHLRNVMEKLMLHTRLQIAAYVHRESQT
jgi:DNA-binding NarL/FixJ family response regulator